jgi:deoxyxylulose-5-phosphate synthase
VGTTLELPLINSNLKGLKGVIDLFSIQPIDRDELIASARAAGGVVITVEDHYAHGGLGDAVLSALAEEKIRAYKLAVREIPHSGKAEELIEKFGISSSRIVETVKAALRQLARRAFKSWQNSTPISPEPKRASTSSLYL